MSDLTADDSHPGAITAPTDRSVAIVGAGLAGTLVAANLLRDASTATRVVLIERSGVFGPGVAYSTIDEAHLLNVCAAKMSAFPDEPGHLMAWVGERRGAEVDPGEYLPRRLYGEYVRELLEQAPAGESRLERVTATVTGLRRGESGVRIELTGAPDVEADRAVLAVGSVPGATPADLPDDPRVVLDPWARGAFDGVAPDTRAVIVGTSLTAVDVALTLARLAPEGRSVAVSRRGLVPFTHLPGMRTPAPSPAIGDDVATVAEIEQVLREHAGAARQEGYDWRDAFDSLRPHTQRLWRQLPVAERRAFLRDRVREWDVRRHRIAPEVGAKVSELRETGRLRVAGGGVGQVRALEDALRVEIDGETVEADLLVNCAGAGTDVAGQIGEPLAGMLERGDAVADELGLGVQAGPDGELTKADGGSADDVFVLGPLRRGQLWETVAVPEIRVQAARIAGRVAATDGLGAEASAGRAS